MALAVARGSRKSEAAITLLWGNRVISGALASHRQLLRDVLSDVASVVAAGWRGVDLLKWLCSIGEDRLAWTLEVHDIRLMRNALEGRAARLLLPRP